MLQFQPGDALLVVDVQYDFFPDGALGVPEGNQVIEPINRLIQQAQAAGIPIIFSRDWHPENHCSFKENGGIWPAHCIQNTEGAGFHPDVNRPDDAIIVNKAIDPNHEAYSAFEGITDADQRPLPDILKELNVKRVVIGGLALDYCVKESALDAIKHQFDTYIVQDACRAIATEQVNKITEDLRQKGITIE